jgi:serine/threonine protein kinase
MALSVACAKSMCTPTSPAEISPLKLGDVVANKYVVEGIVGSGGMGIVYCARHVQLNEKVALKFLRPEVAYLPGLRARFEREAQAAVRIRSEHIVRIFDVGTLRPDFAAEGPAEIPSAGHDRAAARAADVPADLPYIVMEFLDGCDLEDLLRMRGVLPAAEAAEYVAQACVGVADAHAAGVIHRDLRPSNLFLTHRPDGSPLVKVLDFGISKATSPAKDRTDLTWMDGILGSPKYISPEQARSARSADARADVWSLGVILHCLLAGEAPFSGKSTTELLSAILSAAPKPLSDARPDAPAELEAIVLKCVHKDVDQRTQSVAQLALALAPWVRPDTRALVERIAGAPPGIVRSLASLEHADLPLARAVESFGRTPSALDPSPAATATTVVGRMRAHWPRPKRSRIFAAAVGLSAALAFGATWLAHRPGAASGPEAASNASLVTARESSGATAATLAPEPAQPAPADIRLAPAGAGDFALAPTGAGAQPRASSISALPRVAPRVGPRKPPAVPTGPPLPATGKPFANLPAVVATAPASNFRSLIDERK